MLRETYTPPSKIIIEMRIFRLRESFILTIIRTGRQRMTMSRASSIENATSCNFPYCRHWPCTSGFHNHSGELPLKINPTLIMTAQATQIPITIEDAKRNDGTGNIRRYRHRGDILIQSAEELQNVALMYSI